MTVTTDKEKYGVTLAAEPNHRILGTKYKKEYKDLMAAIRKLSDNQLAEYQNTGKVTVLGNVLVEDELQLSYKVGSTVQGESPYEAHYDNDVSCLFLITLWKTVKMCVCVAEWLRHSAHDHRVMFDSWQCSSKTLFFTLLQSAQFVKEVHVFQRIGCVRLNFLENYINPFVTNPLS